MMDPDATREQLLAENAALRRRVETLEGAEAERRQGEEDLCHSRTILAEAEKLLHAGAWEWDLCANQWTFSDEWLQIHGSRKRTATSEELLPLVHPADRQRIAEALQQVRDGVAPYEIEHRILREDTGEVRVVKARGRYVRDAAGRVVRVYGFSQDITEQKRAEATLREREAQLLEAQDVASLGFYVMDVPRGTFTTSSILDGIFGIPADYPKTVAGWAELVYPEDRARMLDYLLHDVLEKKQPFDREYRVVRHGDQQVRWVHGRGRLQLGEHGQPVSMVGTIQDITLRKQAEEALRKSERSFRAMFEQAPLGIALHESRSGHFVRINQRFCEIAGRAEAEMLQIDYQSITHPEDLQLCVNNVARLVNEETRISRWEKRYVRPDGSIAWVSLTLVPMWEEGESQRFHLTMVEDITERKHAEEALRKSYEELEERVRERTAELRATNEQLQQQIAQRQRTEEELHRSYAQLQTIYDGMVDGLNILDLETLKAVRVNAAMCHMTGYTEEESLQLTQAQVHPPEALPKIAENIREHVAGRLSRATDIPLLRKDGSTFYADIGTSRILYNHRPCLICFFHDTTDRRKAQEALQRERRTLEHMLRASDHERQLIAYDIHDGLAQQLAGAIMQFQVHEHLKQAQPEDAQRAHDAGVTLLRQGHAESRRLISGVRPPILDEAGVLAAISHLVNERGLEPAPKIEVHSKVRFTRLAPILENAIYRIVQEGLTNACKHSRSPRVRISLLQRNDRLRIEIRDWGIGFNPQNAPDSRYGLQGMRERARLLGGNFRIHSRPNQGAAVVVEVPIVERAAER